MSAAAIARRVDGALTLRHIFIAGMAIEAAAAIRALQYYHRNPKG